MVKYLKKNLLTAPKIYRAVNSSRPKELNWRVKHFDLTSRIFNSSSSLWLWRISLDASADHLHLSFQNYYSKKKIEITDTTHNKEKRQSSRYADGSYTLFLAQTLDRISTIKRALTLFIIKPNTHAVKIE